MIKIYGSMLCKDCVQCRKDLDNWGVAYEYLDFADNLSHLKEFLAIRDKEAIFFHVKEEGRIGIPLLITPEGEMTLDWMQFAK